MAATASSGGASDEGHEAAKANVVEEGHEESDEAMNNAVKAMVAQAEAANVVPHSIDDWEPEDLEITESSWEDYMAMDPAVAIVKIKYMDGIHKLLRKRLRTA